MRVLLVAAFVSFLACVTPAPLPPPPGPSPDVYASACANLAAIGCPEGARPNCARVMQDAQEAHLTDLHPECLAGLAKTASKEEARACESVRCP